MKKDLEELTFAEALKLAVDGDQITRKEWADRGCYGFFLNDVLMIRRDFKYHQWILSSGDVMANDWEVI